MLGLRIDRLVHAALAGGGLALTACPGGGQDTDTDTETDSTDGTDVTTDVTDSTDSDAPTTTVGPTTVTTTDPPPPPPPPADVTPPVLLDVSLVDTQVLRLTFTEAIAPVDLVNPKRFRLSLGLYYQNNYYGYNRSIYQAPEIFNHQQICEERCYYDVCYEQCYDGPALELDILDVLADAQDPAALVILLENPVAHSLCQLITDLGNNFGGDVGLLLHYADGGSSQITDLAGLPLAPSGESWVKQADEDYFTFDNQRFPEQNPFLPIPCPF